MNKQNTTTATPEEKPETTAIYEVLAATVKIGGVIAYRTARVNLTKTQADALNAAQPDTVRFLGI
jgi:hypothetical protein